MSRNRPSCVAAYRVPVAAGLREACHWPPGPSVGHDGAVNEQSLDRVNAFLAAAAERTQVGDVMAVTPAEIGRELGFPDAAVDGAGGAGPDRPQAARAGQGSYRLLDAEPVEADEKESIGRRPRETRQAGPRRRPSAQRCRAPPRYSDFGRAVVDRLVDLGREAAELRASLRTAREEARESRQARDEAESRARSLAEKVRELEARAEMAESNLRTLLATVRGESAEDLPATRGSPTPRWRRSSACSKATTPRRTPASSVRDSSV